MDEKKVAFLDGLLWYLETRNWAREKLEALPHGGSATDIKIYHYLYFSNAFSAVDLVNDYLTGVDFPESVRAGLIEPGDLDYARELRNAIVHRGLDPTTAGESDGQRAFILCPPEIANRKGGQQFACSFRYTVQLAQVLDGAANAAIADMLASNGLLESAAHLPEKDATLAAIRASRDMPDWAKGMAEQAFEDIDFDHIATDLAATRIRRLKTLLGQPSGLAAMASRS